MVARRAARAHAGAMVADAASAGACSMKTDAAARRAADAPCVGVDRDEHQRRPQHCCANSGHPRSLYGPNGEATERRCRRSAAGPRFYPDDPLAREQFGKLAAGRGILNLHRMMAYTPELMKASGDMAVAFRQEAILARALAEGLGHPRGLDRLAQVQLRAGQRREHQVEAQGGEHHGAALRSLGVDHQPVGRAPLGTKLPVRYTRDGELLGEARDLAPYLGAAFDTGRWWISADELCHRWKHWFNSEPQCLRLRKEGRTIYWHNRDGDAGTATIVVPAPIVAAAPILLPPEEGKMHLTAAAAPPAPVAALAAPPPAPTPVGREGTVRQREAMAVADARAAPPVHDSPPTHALSERAKPRAASRPRCTARSPRPPHASSAMARFPPRPRRKRAARS